MRIEKSIFFYLDLKGVNIGVTQFHTQFTIFSRNFDTRIEYRCYIVALDFGNNGVIYRLNYFEKVCFCFFLFFDIFFFTFKLFLQSNFTDQNRHFLHIGENISKTGCFCFLFKA